MIQIDQLFEEKFLNQTKQLSTGQTIKILSRKCRRNQTNFVYSCHLCGFIDLGDEQALHLHVTDKMHRELLKLPKLPFRNWMKEVVVQEEKHEKPCTLGCGSDCSDLKAMVDNMCGLKKEPNTEQMPRNLKRASTSKSSGSSKLKHRRSRSPKARESRSRSRKAAK